MKKRKPRAIAACGHLTAKIEPYSNIPRSPGGIAMVKEVLLYPDNARKLAAWLIAYADWHDELDRKNK